MIEALMLYTVNTNRAISETLEGETIIIDLESGMYYSLNGSGSEIWNLLLHGISLEQLCDYFLSTTNANKDLILRAVTSFLNTLKEEALIIETSTSSFTLPHSVEKKEFSNPESKKYEDMQEMLLADPIHDVDTAGWPTLKK